MYAQHRVIGKSLIFLKVRERNIPCPLKGRKKAVKKTQRSPHRGARNLLKAADAEVVGTSSVRRSGFAWQRAVLFSVVVMVEGRASSSFKKVLWIAY